MDAANHIGALMAQKQHLQQLESEYALKIQTLKEAQVLRNRAAPSEAPSEQRPKPAVLPEPKVCLPGSPGPPQPSLHDLTQDILVLGSDDGPEPEADEAEAGEPKGDDQETTSAPPRRRSFRRSSSTKPNLEQLSSAPVAKAPPAPAAAAAKNAADAATDACAAGLDLEALRRRHQQQLGLGELLLQELASLGELHHVEDQDAHVHKTATVCLPPPPPPNCCCRVSFCSLSFVHTCAGAGRGHGYEQRCRVARQASSLRPLPQSSVGLQVLQVSFQVHNGHAGACRTLADSAERALRRSLP